MLFKQIVKQVSVTMARTKKTAKAPAKLVAQTANQCERQIKEVKTAKKPKPGNKKPGLIRKFDKIRDPPFGDYDRLVPLPEKLKQMQYIYTSSDDPNPFEAVTRYFVPKDAEKIVVQYSDFQPDGSIKRKKIQLTYKQFKRRKYPNFIKDASPVVLMDGEKRSFNNQIYPNTEEEMMEIRHAEYFNIEKQKTYPAELRINGKAFAFIVPSQENTNKS
jgi:signal peptidase I